MIELTEDQKLAIMQHCIAEYNDRQIESGGYLDREGKIHPLDNVANKPSIDWLPPEDQYKEMLENGVAIYHSHTNGNGKFTPDDGLFCKSTDKPLFLYDLSANDFKDISPYGDKPYEGRHFCWGVQDCYSLVRDYYRREFDIHLNDYDRGDWESAVNSPDWNKFLENYEQENFRFESKGSQKFGDVLLFSIGGRRTHLGIWLGNDEFLHQLMGEMSGKALLGSQWYECCVGVLRHEESK